MVTAVRIARVLVLVMLALLTISFVIAAGRSETGPLEKFLLVASIGACLYGAVRVATVAESALRRSVRKHT